MLENMSERILLHEPHIAGDRKTRETKYVRSYTPVP
jgi:hypothetical protein